VIAPPPAAVGHHDTGTLPSVRGAGVPDTPLAPDRPTLVRAGARFDKGVMVERPDEVQEVAA
jgi:hypothetical protein